MKLNTGNGLMDKPLALWNVCGGTERECLVGLPIVNRMSCINKLQVQKYLKHHVPVLK
jgi:hypothetical protein